MAGLSGAGRAEGGRVATAAPRRSVLPTAARLGLLLLLMTCVGLATVSLWIPALIYRPTGLDRADPASWNIPQATLVAIPSTHGGALSGWWAPPGSPDAQVILILHGRSANISTRSGIARRLIADGFGVLMFDYRGYGRSPGRPSERGLTEDAEAAYRWLIQQGVAPSRLVVLGQSLGDAPAAELGASRSIGALVLVSPFTSLPGAAQDAAPWLPVGIVPWTRNRFDVGSSVARLHAPLLLVVSSSDGLVPLRNSRRLAALVPGFHWLEAEGLHHDGLLAGVTIDGRLSKAIKALADRRIDPPADASTKPGSAPRARVRAG